MKRSELLFSAVTLPIDYLALLFAAFVAYWMRYFPLVQEIRPVVFDLPYGDYFKLSALISLVWLAVFAISGLYRMGGSKKISEELSRVFVACSASLALVLAVMVFSRFLFDSRFMILASWLLAIIFVSVGRLIVRLTQRQIYQFGIGVHRVVLIGNSHMAHILTHEFVKRPGLGFRVVKHWDNFDVQVGHQISELVRNDKIDDVIQINPNLSTETTGQLIDLVNQHHLTYRYTADLLGTQLANHEVSTIAGTPVIEVKHTRLDGWGKIAKRLFDIFGAGVLIVLASPVMLIATLAIILETGWPPLFAYQRVGQYGKFFLYFKFRSMVKDAHKLRSDPTFLAQHQNLREGTPMTKFKDDPRITKVGKALRRFSIDELPELFLVLSGKMSLVGPRPHEQEEVELYQKHHQKLLTIKPGITGLAQVSGRSDLAFEDEVKLDVFYIENWSPSLDVRILFKTPWAVLRPRKSN